MRPATPRRSGFSRGFTVLELVITAAILVLVSGITYQSTATYLQEQRLSQTAQTLLAYLQSARARAEREASGSSSCQLAFSGSISGTTISDPVIGPSDSSNNVCSALASLDLSKGSGLRGLTATMVTKEGDSTLNSLYPITFNRTGTIASEVVQGTTVSLTAVRLTSMPRLIYLAASGISQQRCLFLDLSSIRLGWRSGSSGVCSYASS